MIRILGPLSMALVPLSLAMSPILAVSGSAAPVGAPTMEVPLHKPAVPIGYAPNHSCELRVNESWGTVNLEGFAYADHQANGSYELTVRQGSGSQIVQGGDFSTYPNAGEPLSTVGIGSSGDYSATLTVRWADGGAPCTKSVGGGSRFPSFF